LHIFNAEKSVGGHVNKFVISSFLAESHFTWQLDMENFRKSVKFEIKIPNGC